MTTIVGIQYPGGVVIAADRQQTQGGAKSVSALPKVFWWGELLCGLTGAAAIRQAIQHSDLPVQEAEQDDLTYLVKTVIPTIRQAVSDAGQMEKENEREQPNLALLVALHGILYEIDAAFYVDRIDAGYHAIGSGGEAARGALAALDDLAPVELAKRAVEIASEIDLYSGFGVVCEVQAVEVKPDDDHDKVASNGQTELKHGPA